MATNSDEYALNLATYKAQLQQVEAALTNDPDNEELLKLKHDLGEVIELTSDLLSASQGASTSSAEAEVEDTVSHPWNVGDRCLACWSKEQQYYPATIDKIHDEITATVIFDVYENVEVKQLSKLKDIPPDYKSNIKPPSADSAISKKQLLAKQREYKKKKQQKKADRMKQQEQLHEDQKKSWLNFSSKATKGKKGFTKKSIFASPDVTDGKVGVGTCGVGGQPMTKFKMPKHNVVRK
ncbi:survival of motor neuron-related-splicing factor 30-like [Lytechinus variegatus]|uniref:survival of motor neuron-related-splicing factor 30-like n=1 Tax=Lytechinus variegatus TaxID=7654 RepID=UPI001BB2AB47|nr:survival of motor neuron-related-splicing factor 30-like [Lytechinus variegatus]